MVITSTHRHQVCIKFSFVLWSQYLKYRKIKERQEAVCQLLNDSYDSVSVLSSLLSKLPDLEKLLCACYQYKVYMYIQNCIFDVYSSFLCPPSWNHTYYCILHLNSASHHLLFCWSKLFRVLSTSYLLLLIWQQKRLIHLSF